VKTCGERQGLSKGYRSVRQEEAAVLYGQLTTARARLYEKATARFLEAK
jgi:hypothetical protein